LLKRFAALLVASLAIAATIGAGCGEDDDSSASGGVTVAVTTSDLSKAEFAKEASDICSRERRDIPTQIATYQEKNPPGDKSPEVVQAEGVEAVILPVLEKEIAQVRKLGAPSGDEEQVEAILSGQQKAIDEVAALKEIEPVEDSWERYFDETNKLMVDFGIGDCAVR
jgi:hypothetical protein